MQRYYPIQNYGIIGDLDTVALVGPHGLIDFMCYPDFDSPTIFCALLDKDKGGYFQVRPATEQAREKKLYLPSTNILLTQFLTDDGISELTDFMPTGPGCPPHTVVRTIKAVKGEQTFRMCCAPRFDYARSSHKLELSENYALFISNGSDKTALRLLSSEPLEKEAGDCTAAFRLTAGNSATFILTFPENRGITLGSENSFVASMFKETTKYWRGWIGHSKYKGRWREIVNRSALTLKLLTSSKYGSIIASPTFGLPETPGGKRNWDYRYVWIRDASFSIYSLMRLGFFDEASAFIKWLEKRCEEISEDQTLQIAYSASGSRSIPEQTLPHLEGYMQSSPVRIGNDAASQLQLDIYGEFLDSLYIFDKYADHISYQLWQHVCQLVEQVIRLWRHPDESIWEVRGGRREFLHSRLMCWVAIDRALRLAQRRSLPCDRDRWQKNRDEIFKDIFEAFWDPSRRTFVQHKGTDATDAATLLMPLVRFISPTDPKWLSTVRAIETDLVEDVLVYRYRPGRGALDGFSDIEGSFCMCSFWYAECLSRAGEMEKARLCFEKMLGYANRLGLYAEELGPGGEFLGNYPQAFTHLALISSAYDLDRRLDAAGLTI